MEYSPPSISIKELIVSLTDEAWKINQEGVLLARLGSEISKRAEIAKIELGDRKLSKFIDEELFGKVKILPSPDNPIVKIAVPANATIDESNIKQYFPRADPGKKATQASGVSHAIVLAFSRPIAEGKKRAIILSPVARFEDIEENQPAPDSAEILDSKWIISPEQISNSNERSKKIIENIMQWRESLEISPTAISAKQKSTESSSRTALELFISCLSEADQKRITLPLDIVAKLHKHQVR